MSIPETPYTRLEMYLDEIARNGGGGGGGGGSSTLSGLTDVDISNPTDGQTLVYNAASQKWANGESAGGGVLVCSLNGQTGALDHTYQEIADATFAIIKIPFLGGTVTWMVLQSGPDSGNTYAVKALESDSFTLVKFVADSPNGYPVIEMSGQGG